MLAAGQSMPIHTFVDGHPEQHPSVKWPINSYRSGSIADSDGSRAGELLFCLVMLLTLMILIVELVMYGQSHISLTSAFDWKQTACSLNPIRLTYDVAVARKVSYNLFMAPFDGILGLGMRE